MEGRPHVQCGLPFLHSWDNISVMGSHFEARRRIPYSMDIIVSCGFPLFFILSDELRSFGELRKGYT